MRIRIVLCAAVMASCAQGVVAAATVTSSAACASAARQQAGKLLAFHFGDESDELHIGDEVKPLPAIVNPANRRQRFDVLEVWGFIYKGQYRMRFEYFRLKDGECVLMGQEILEHATL